MSVLRFLEGIRTPFGESFFSLITHLGEETVFIVVGLIFFWCISKKHGYYILSVGFLGTIINQFLKLLFRIPRPWVKDPEFTIVESARAEATGYSFPSGHTQSAVGVFGAIARISNIPLVKGLCIVACVLVPVSRMYLGVHTPLDVGVSLIVALALILVLYPIIEKAVDDPKKMRVFMAVMTLLAVVFVTFVHLYEFPADVDADNLEHGIKNAYKILGCILGLWLSFELDSRYIHFETKAKWWQQIIKLALGLGILLLIKSGLKAPLYSICNGNYIADGIRYFLICIFAGCIWPLSFKLYKK